MTTRDFFVRDLDPTIGEAVAKRSFLRKDDNGQYETWGDVAHRVALGNTSLHSSGKKDFDQLRKHIASGTILTSGRHLQHGDENQSANYGEKHSNCSTASTATLLMYLALNGSGVGTCYDDDVMDVSVDWKYCPEIFCYLDRDHDDYTELDDTRFGFRYAEVSWAEEYRFVVPDSREGWAHAVEFVENITWTNQHGETDIKRVVLDFSNVRPNGTPIKGMQNKPASGPMPLINSFLEVNLIVETAKRDAWMPWRTGKHVHHTLTACVAYGGVRRIARIATKFWKDKEIFDYISIKKNGGLWTANNSISVDAEFWRECSVPGTHANAVFLAATSAAYADGTGEPGFLNVDKLHINKIGLEAAPVIGSQQFQITETTQRIYRNLYAASRVKQYSHIVNPCVTGDTWIMTDEGAKQVCELVGRPFNAIIDGKSYPCKQGFFYSGKKQVFDVQTTRGYSVKATADHKFLVSIVRKGKVVDYQWKPVRDLTADDHLTLSKNRDLQWKGEGTFNEGYLVGQILGDGGHNPEKYRSYVRFWGDHRFEMAEMCLAMIADSDIKTGRTYKGKGIVNQNNNTVSIPLKGLSDLASKYLEAGTKRILPSVEKTSSDFHKGFLSGFFDSDGTVGVTTTNGKSVRLTQADSDKLLVVQRMLSRLGIASQMYWNRRKPGVALMPDGKGGQKLYTQKATHELALTNDNFILFQDVVGFKQSDKRKKIHKIISEMTLAKHDTFAAKVRTISECGIHNVYDCNIYEIHRFDGNGVVLSNCSEVSLDFNAGFCVLCDIAPYHASSLYEIKDAVAHSTRFAIRTNLMDSVYADEVKRTNRIGISLTGVHEFMLKFFGLGFMDALNESHPRFDEFWSFLAELKRIVVKTAKEYSAELGMVAPHTDTCIKPAGSVSCLFNITQGIHLPSMMRYLRWVQFPSDHEMIQEYEIKGYPVRRDLVQYKNTAIVGFPTKTELCRLAEEMGVEDKIVTAGDASMEDQFKWLWLLEKYWIQGVDESGEPLEDTGNQISATIKFKPENVSLESFRQTILEWQPKIRCCSIMPQTTDIAYEYQPEEPISKEDYDALVAKIERMEEDVDLIHVQCEGGACPIDFNK